MANYVSPFTVPKGEPEQKRSEPDQIRRFDAHIRTILSKMKQVPRIVVEIGYNQDQSLCTKSLMKNMHDITLVSVFSRKKDRLSKSNSYFERICETLYGVTTNEFIPLQQEIPDPIKAIELIYSCNFPVDLVIVYLPSHSREASFRSFVESMFPNVVFSVFVL